MFLLIYSDEQAWASASEETRQRVYDGHRRLGEELEKRKAFVAGSELAPQGSSRTVSWATILP